METLAVVVATLLLLLGAAWVFLPFLSGPLLAWCGWLACHLIWPAGPVGAPMLIFGLVLVGSAKIVDTLAGVWTARRFGASWSGACGAFLGGLVFTVLGLFTGVGLLPCVLLGPAVGAVVGELLYGREARAALKSGAGAFLGFFVATLFNLVVCGVMGAVFIVAVFANLLAT